MAEEYKITVDTGVIEVPVYNKDEKVGSLVFNPTDMAIIKRYEHAVEEIEKLNELNDFKEIESALIKQFDELFLSNTAETLFCKVSPLTVMANGDLFFETMLEGAGNIIEKVTEKRLKKKQARIQKAVSKYHK